MFVRITVVGHFVFCKCGLLVCVVYCCWVSAVWLYVNSVVVATITHPLFASFLVFYV